MDNPAVAHVVSLDSADLLAGSGTSTRGLIHDFTAFNRGLLTNVRRGGFRNDLSMYLEKAPNAIPTEPLYTVARRNGINMSELWLHYNMYKELKSGGRFTFTTGGTMDRSTPYLQMEGSLSATYTDNEYSPSSPARPSRWSSSRVRC